MQDDVVALFAYDRWANTKVLDACYKLTAEQYVAEPVPGWSSVRSTIYHIALATEFNLRTLADKLNPVLPDTAYVANDAVRARICSQRGLVKAVLPTPRSVAESFMVIRRSSSGRCTGSDLSITASMRLKIAVFAPMPIASEITATTVNAGLARSPRIV